MLQVRRMSAFPRFEVRPHTIATNTRLAAEVPAKQGQGDNMKNHVCALMFELVLNFGEG